MPLIDLLPKLPAAKHNKPKHTIPTEPKPSDSSQFANNLKLIARHINVVDVEQGKQMFLETATFSLEHNKPYLVRVEINLNNITTKLELQKYLYNIILRGEKLYTR